MDPKTLINMAMDALSLLNGDRRVVLYLDPTMVHTRPDGVRLYLPVMKIEGDDGYYQLAGRSTRDQASGHFGALIEPARELVAEINAERGIDRDEARRIVLDTTVRSRHE